MRGAGAGDDDGDGAGDDNDDGDGGGGDDDGDGDAETHQMRGVPIRKQVAPQIFTVYRRLDLRLKCRRRVRCTC